MEQDRTKKIINIDYGFIHGSYWMVYAVFGSFSSAYLLNKGYSNSDIGIVLAAGNILSVVLQPIMADWADRSRKISVFGVSQLITLGVASMAAVLLAVPGKGHAVSVLFVMIVGWQAVIQPLINSLSFKISACGINVNFGICRAIGSLAYAFICWALGIFAEKVGTELLPVWGIAMLVMLSGSLLAMKLHFGKTGRNLKESGASDLAEEKEINLPEFVRRNKLFCVLNVGIGLLFFSNNTLNNFMLQTVSAVGGTGADMGGVFAVMAVLELPTLIFFEQLRKKIRCQRLIKIAAAGFLLRIFVIYIAPDVTVIYLAHIFQTVGFALMLPSVVRFTAETMSEGEAVKGQAMYTSMVSVSSVFASILGGMIIDASGVKAMLLVSTLVTGAGAAIVVFVVDKVRSHREEGLHGERDEK